jgi:uncharacterized membrane-anchored protein
LTLQEVQGNYVRLRLGTYTLKWERHTEFTRYSLVQALPEDAGLDSQDPELLSHLALPEGWLSSIPGRTFAAIKLIMLHDDLSNPTQSLIKARRWFGEHAVVASRMGNPAHSMVVTDFRLRSTGFERVLVMAPQAPAKPVVVASRSACSNSKPTDSWPCAA